MLQVPEYGGLDHGPPGSSTGAHLAGDRGAGGRVQTTILERIYETLSPLAFGLAAVGARAMGVTRLEISERMGALPRTHGPVLWFHGASAGELAAAAELTAVLRRWGFSFTACYTATNRSGVEFARRFAAVPSVSALVPWDVRRWIARGYDCLKPAAVFVVETELWPELVLEANRRDIPVFLVSARIYPRDYPAYRLIRPLIGSTIRRVTAILAQSEIERERFLALGADPAHCVIAGNLKYLAAHSDGGSSLLSRESLGLRHDDQLVVFGSIHRDEIDVILPALKYLDRSRVRAIIAPRHMTSVPYLTGKCRELAPAVRSDGPKSPDWRVMILDTLGELRRVYALADLAVVGGGFARHGGHNPFEPVLAGTPVMFGTHFEHFEDEVRRLLAVTPEAQARSARYIAPLISEWLGNETRRRYVLDAQRSALPDADEIAKRYASALTPWLQARLA